MTDLGFGSCAALDRTVAIVADVKMFLVPWGCSCQVLRSLGNIEMPADRSRSNSVLMMIVGFVARGSKKIMLVTIKLSEAR